MTLGLLELPATARLRLHSHSSPLLAPLDFHPLYNVSGAGGVLLWTGLAARGVGADANERFLEGCVRARIDGRPEELLASGTEDYFYGTGHPAPRCPTPKTRRFGPRDR